MDVRSPIRLSGLCRTWDDTELARQRKRPFSWSDKYLEEYKQRAEPLLGECLSFVFVTLCDIDSQHHSLRRPVMCTCAWIVCRCLCACMCAHNNGRPNSPTLTSLLHLNSCAYGICSCDTITVLDTNFSTIESKGYEGVRSLDLPVLIYGRADKSAGVPTLHCQHLRWNKIEPRWAKDRYNWAFYGRGWYGEWLGVR